MIVGKFQLPLAARVNKFIPKTKFYEKAVVSPKVQNEFVHTVQKITWQYKLAESTIGISKTETVTEIQIFEIALKAQTIPKNVLKVIDKAIPYQILYQFVYQDEVAYGITLKGDILKNMASKDSLTQNYYFSAWNEVLIFDFTGLDLEKVYQKLIKAFIKVDNKHDIHQQADFETLLTTDQTIKHLEKEIATLSSKISKEKQFNKKVELNKTLLAKQSQLQTIINGECV